MLESALNDLLYVIETHAYLPFTRKGTITINGDRRIKKGTFILFEPTQEIFHVDSVSNSYSATTNQIDRTTTLEVSRGMKEYNIIKNDFIKFANGDIFVPEFSYFDIVNIDLIRKNITDKLSLTNNDDKEVSIDINSSVNEDAFNYFLKRKNWQI